MQYRLKTRKSFPPGGFDYVQKETGWRLPEGKSFSQAVELIVKHRKANPKFLEGISTDEGAVAMELEQFIAEKLLFNPIYVYSPDQKKSPLIPNFLPPEPTSHPSELQPQGQSALPAVLNGLKTIGEWTIKGSEIVPAELAQSRANVCEVCPLNKPQEGFSFKKSVAKNIKKLLEYKADKKLVVSNEYKLGICDACACHLPLKVWTPLKFILGNQSPEVESKLDSACWIRSENGYGKTRIFQTLESGENFQGESIHLE